MTYEAFHDELRDTRLPLNNGAGSMPAVGFGTLFRDLSTTTEAVKCALETGFRHFDCAERYRNEAQIGVAFQQTFAAGQIRREDVFVTTKLWNTNHRPERVKPAFEASCQRLQVDYRLLLDPHAIRLSAWRRSRPSGCFWTCDLRWRNPPDRHLARPRKSGG